ncbi:putative uncharacterized protein FLJ38767 [Manis pentadactyla]|uniref:putative uncharacterized protein FLJ38767 n=1 Tax=Manis pentadactyla TaxID=143292 RepID=UPI00255C7DEF|nr:putative uncharacterized protein FLJ38767 [Manis pentadactyla]
MTERRIPAHLIGRENTFGEKDTEDSHPWAAVPEPSQPPADRPPQPPAGSAAPRPSPTLQKRGAPAQQGLSPGTDWFSVGSHPSPTYGTQSVCLGNVPSPAAQPSWAAGPSPEVKLAEQAPRNLSGSERSSPGHPGAGGGGREGRSRRSGLWEGRLSEPQPRGMRLQARPSPGPACRPRL